jgi:CubicO group peptidase (beta-lactamase class C family)
VAGLAIGILKGEQVYAKGFGVRSIETQEPVTPSSLFHIASIFKTFVATACNWQSKAGWNRMLRY